MRSNLKVQNMAAVTKQNEQTLKRCSNELLNDFRAKLQNPPNFDNFGFSGSMRTNCST